jgi:hypothetical protein
MFIPSILWYRKNLDEKSLLELGYGKPYYSSINYKNEKYYLDDANQFSFTWGYEVGNNFRLLLPEWRDPDRKALILFKYFSTKFSASTKDSSKSISSTIFTGQGIVRIYF